MCSNVFEFNEIKEYPKTLFSYLAAAFYKKTVWYPIHKPRKI